MNQWLGGSPHLWKAFVFSFQIPRLGTAPDIPWEFHHLLSYPTKAGSQVLTDRRLSGTDNQGLAGWEIFSFGAQITGSESQSTIYNLKAANPLFVFGVFIAAHPNKCND